MLEDAQLMVLGAGDPAWSGWDHPAWYLGMGLNGVLWLTLIAVIGLAVVALVRGARRGPPGAGNSAKSELDVRYARGEIDRGQYLERKRDLA